MELIVVGKTVESYRMALESEIRFGGVGLAKVLRKSDQEAFDELIDMSKSFASDRRQCD